MYCQLLLKVKNLYLIKITLSSSPMSSSNVGRLTELTESKTVI